MAAEAARTPRAALQRSAAGKLTSAIASCLIVQHVEPEEPYAIGAALAAAGVDVEVCAVHTGAEPPADASGLDGLVVMGGPMSAGSDDGFPSRRAELALLTDAVAREVPTLGVCLGAQLLAAATGGRVVPGDGLEVGWGPITLDAAAATDPLLAAVTGPLTVLHWHGDTYERPPDAPLLASSARYPEQAFRVGAGAWGLQFHVEVDEGAVARFASEFPADASAAPGGTAALTAGTAPALEALETVRRTILARFADLVAVHRRVTATPLP